VVKLEIFGTTRIILIVDIRNGVDNCGRGAMFGGITKIGLKGNT